MNLSDLAVGKEALIEKINVKGPLKRRLLDMGVLVGEKIKITKVAPLGDPLEITIKNYQLSLRKSEAQEILIKEI